jgi:hypothetical protein
MNQWHPSQNLSDNLPQSTRRPLRYMRYLYEFSGLRGYSIGSWKLSRPHFLFFR